MSWQTVCTKNQVQEDFPFSTKVNGQEIGIYVLDGEYYALEDVCPHAYALLSQGFVEDGKVECPLHEAMFDIKTGKCLREPADRDVKAYPVRILDDSVQLQLSDED